MRRSRALRPAVQPLEGRALLSVAGAAVLATRAAAALAVPKGVKTDPAAVAAVLAALNGGAGSEFVTLIRRQVPNLSGVIGGFVSGRTTAFSTPGIAAKVPSWQPLYTGTRYDHLTATLAGAVVLPGNRLELAGVMRGPFDEASPSQVVFGLDRGAGARLGPVFASRPKITPDVLVTVNVGPYGRNDGATVTDLTTGAVKAVDPSRVQIQGAVVRVFVDLSDLPSKGLAAARYRFAMWTRASAAGGIENVGSFLAESSMTAVGVLSTAKR